jgi:hypothetical protein
VSRRSPGNERYQKHTSPKGQTRKSAAAAKPTRKEGSATSSSAKSKSKSSATSASGRYSEPDTPEYKYWRRLWWISLLVGLIFVAISFYLQYYLKGYSWSRTAGIVTITISYAAIIAAFFIDYRKLRLMRTGKYVYKSDKPAKPDAEKPADKTDAGDSGNDTP